MESLLCIIHAATQLDISCITNFPISIFIPCINLIELTLDFIEPVIDDMNSYKHEYFYHDVVPQVLVIVTGKPGVSQSYPYPYPEIPYPPQRVWVLMGQGKGSIGLTG